MLLTEQSHELTCLIWNDFKLQFSKYIFHIYIENFCGKLGKVFSVVVGGFSVLSFLFYFCCCTSNLKILLSYDRYWILKYNLLQTSKNHKTFLTILMIYWLVWCYQYSYLRLTVFFKATCNHKRIRYEGSIYHALNVQTKPGNVVRFWKKKKNTIHVRVDNLLA